MEIEIPRLLRLRLRYEGHEEAFDEAVRQGFIQQAADGHLEWMLGSKTLLAYFMGRLFCGDTAKYSRCRHAMLWQRGSGAFPGKELHELFGYGTLKILRCKRENFAPPKDFQVIDSLFVTMD